jgi:hypothetical protein
MKLRMFAMSLSKVVVLGPEHGFRIKINIV